MFFNKKVYILLNLFLYMNVWCYMELYFGFFVYIVLQVLDVGDVVYFF